MLELLPYKFKYNIKFDLFMEVLKTHYIKQGFDVKVDSSLLIITMKDTPTPNPNKKIESPTAENSSVVESQKENETENK